MSIILSDDDAPAEQESSPHRRKSMVALEEPQLDYAQVESIPPLPLYALLAADHQSFFSAGRSKIFDVIF